MRFWKTFIKVTLGTVMPREEARTAAPTQARAKREDSTETLVVAATLPERIMRDITVPEIIPAPKIEVIPASEQMPETKHKITPAKKKLKS